MKGLKLKNLVLISVFALILITSCSKSDDDEQSPDTPIELENEINDFVWQGLNEIYLWQDDVPNLANDKFSTQNDYFTFLNGYDTPESLFDALLYRKNDVDRFSFIVDDYVALENSFQGNSNSSGLDFQLVRLSGSDDLFGYVRYVANDSDAALKDIQRGDFFLTVDGQQLTITNYEDLLFGLNNTFTLGMATINNNSIASNNKDVVLTKTSFTENPILINKVIETNGIKVGYLMYNNFIANFDNALNTSIAELRAQGITELVLDLRYNPGGRVSSAEALSSMITGQFKDEVLIKEQWNTRYQAFFEANTPESLVSRFPDKLLDETPINSLNLNKVYILTTSGTASASELIINGLAPYIDVVQIGTNTTGKYTASVTLYDSSNFGKENANPNHTYAMQPLVYKSANADGKSDYNNGLTPDHIITYLTNSGSQAEGENLLNLGTLGDENEPFLAKALSLITNETAKVDINKKIKGVSIEVISDSKDFTPLGKGMYTTLKTMN